MKTKLPTIILLLIAYFNAFSQYTDIWEEVNTGIGNSGEFKVLELLNVEGELFAHVQAVRSLETDEYYDIPDGLYKFDHATKSWEFYIGEYDQYNMQQLHVVGNAIYGPKGDKIHRLEIGKKEWEVWKTFDPNEIPAEKGKVYFKKSCAAGNFLYGLRGAEKEGFWVVKIDTRTGEQIHLREEGVVYPLPPENVNKMRDLSALKDGRVYVSYTWQARDFQDPPPNYKGTWPGDAKAIYE